MPVCWLAAVTDGERLSAPCSPQTAMTTVSPWAATKFMPLRVWPQIPMQVGCILATLGICSCWPCCSRAQWRTWGLCIHPAVQSRWGVCRHACQGVPRAAGLHPSVRDADCGELWPAERSRHPREPCGSCGRVHREHGCRLPHAQRQRCATSHVSSVL